MDRASEALLALRPVSFRYKEEFDCHGIPQFGLVAERAYLFSGTKDPAEIFAREVGRNQWIRDHLSGGEQFGDHFVTSEFSYRSKYCAADGLVLTGLTGKDEVIWLRACLEACAAIAKAPESQSAS